MTVGNTSCFIVSSKLYISSMTTSLVASTPMIKLLTHPLHLVLAILLLLTAFVSYTAGFESDFVPWILAGVIFELGFWFTVFSSSKMVGRHEDNFH